VDTPFAFVARLEAKPAKAGELAELLAGARVLADAEPGTIRWYAARTSDTTFWIFDTFATTDARQAHLEGAIAQALTERRDDLLATDPEILPADVLAQK
jgi:quinol monooxygenase YgiN